MKKLLKKAKGKVTDAKELVVSIYDEHTEAVWFGLGCAFTLGTPIAIDVIMDKLNAKRPPTESELALLEEWNKTGRLKDGLDGMTYPRMVETTVRIKADEGAFRWTGSPKEFADYILSANDADGLTVIEF